MPLDQPNQSAADYFTQQNNMQGQFGGGYGGPDMPQAGNAQDMMMLMQRQSELGEQSAQADFGRAQKAAILQGSMADDDAARKFELDKKSMAALVAMKQKLLLQDQTLQLRLAGADDEEMDAIREELMQNDSELHDIGRKELEANFQVTGGRKDLQTKISNSYENILKLKNSKETLLKPVLDVFKSKNEGGQNQNIADVIDGMMKQPGGLKSQNNFLKGDAKNILGLNLLAKAAEYTGEIFSGNRTEDIGINEEFGMNSGTMAGIKDAALSYNNGSLQPLMSEFINGTKNDAAASEFASTVLTNVIVSGISNAALPSMDRAATSKSLSNLVNALMDWKGNSANKDPKELQKRIFPLLKEASMAMFGTEDNDAEVSEILDEALAQSSAEVPAYSRGVLSEGSTVLGPDGIRNAALAYSFSQAGRVRALLNAATTGQLSTTKELSRVISSLDESKKSQQITDEFGNVTTQRTYEAGAIERLMQEGGATNKILGNLQPDISKQKVSEEELVQLLNTLKSKKLENVQRGHQLDYQKLPNAVKRGRKKKQDLLDAMETKVESKQERRYGY